MDLGKLRELAVLAALDAGNVINAYQNKQIEVFDKQGGDSHASQVVTEVDRLAQEAILKVIVPTCSEFDLALLTEESKDDHSRFQKDYFWCIDPLDGTLPFTRKESGYSVSVALVAKDGTPQIGVVYDPVHDVLWEASKGQGVQRNYQNWIIKASGNVLVFTYDRSFENHPGRARVLYELEHYSKSLGLTGVSAWQFGGAVINACHALDSAPGCHFKFPKPQKGGGSLWDYAATACLYQEAGASVTDVHGDPLDLNRRDSTFMNHGGVVYATDAELARIIRGILSS